MLFRSPGHPWTRSSPRCASTWRCVCACDCARGLLRSCGVGRWALRAFRVAPPHGMPCVVGARHGCRRSPLCRAADRQPGDLIVDGGNEWFPNTLRRGEELEAKGLRFMGMGVSGGEEGARNGPSLMPGSTREAYEMMEPILTKISAQVRHALPRCRGFGGLRLSVAVCCSRWLVARVAVHLTPLSTPVPGVGACDDTFCAGWRRALRVLRWRAGCRKLRQDGAQRHRVRRHAAHRRGVRHPQDRA